MAATATDEQLIELASSGDEEAVTELVGRHRDAMLLEARVMVGEEQAEQVVHTALTNAMQAMVDGFRPFALEPWLAMMTREAAEGKQTSAPAVVLPDHPADAPISEDEEARLLTAGLRWLPGKSPNGTAPVAAPRLPSEDDETESQPTTALAALFPEEFLARARGTVARLRQPRYSAAPGPLGRARGFESWGTIAAAAAGVAVAATIAVAVVAGGGSGDSETSPAPAAAVSGSDSASGRGGGSADDSDGAAKSGKPDRGDKGGGGRGGSTLLATSAVGDRPGGGAAARSATGDASTTTTTTSTAGGSGGGSTSSSSGGGGGSTSTSTSSGGGGGSVSGPFGPSGSPGAGAGSGGSVGEPTPSAPSPTPPPSSGSDQPAPPPPPPPEDDSPTCGGPISCTVGGLGGGGGGN